MEFNGADSVFVLVCTALVMLMTPALALFYGGMVRKKNVVSTTMHSYVTIALVSIQWILIGYTLVFGNDIGGIIGDLKYALLNGVGFEPNADYAATIPHQGFMLFQMMFAIITPALISGSFAERMRFPAVILFVLAWTTLVYDPIAHWVWGVGGWIRNLGALDFAGGNVVHISSGISALVVALLIGKRKNIKDITAHHIPMTILGGGLLWFGWFGFNAGSALGLNDVALDAFITTNTSAAAAGLSWMLFEYAHTKKFSAIGFISGAVAGLVAITPGAGFVTPIASLAIGAIGGAICYGAVTFLKEKLGYDDALDAFGCHGIGGIWGGIAVGLFGTTGINAAGADGLFYGGGVTLLSAQIISIAATIVYSAIVTFAIVKVIGLVTVFRATNIEEDYGLDVTMHGKGAYGEFGVIEEKESYGA
ncbi:Ammonium transporter NrgA [compost metagenome]